MSRTRESLIAAALALFAPWAVADSITVNTTEDDNQSNSLCSLREAVEYFNKGKPAGGYQGCVAGSVDTTDVITVPKSASPYVIANSAITIRTALQIAGEGRVDPDVTTVQVSGAHRAFVIVHNPRFKPPRCFTTGNCASTPANFDLDPVADSGTAGDYLTDFDLITVKGSLPASPSPLPPNHYIVRIYDNPASGEPVQVGAAEVPMSTNPITWQVLLNTELANGVHLLTWSVEQVNSITGDVAVAKQVQPDTLRVGLHEFLQPKLVQIQNMRLLGGCAADTTCGTGVDDDSDITNNPAAGNTSYDPYALSYSNGVTNTTGNGGLIYNAESLVLSNVMVKDGGAVRGGAIFVNQDGGVSASEAEFNSNLADRGAAIYCEYNACSVEGSLFTANSVTDPAGAGAVLEVANATVPGEFVATRITNVTISGNDGRALSLRGGGRVNGATIVLNKGGIDFNTEDVSVYNTILVGNTIPAGAVTHPDCGTLPAAPTIQTSLVQSGGSCPPSGNQVISNVDNSVGQLMAVETGGRCGGNYGLLCPLADHGGPTFVHMPRLLPGYDLDPAGLGASPIINRGAAQVGGADPESCPSVDQREKSRDNSACDIGAVELQAVTGDFVRSGGVISYGQTYSQYLGKELEDEELLPASKCPGRVSLTVPDAPPYYPPPELAPNTDAVVPDSYNPGVPGCPWLETAPGRGTVKFEADGSYTYTPTSDFHGTDRFYYRAVTTLSNLNVLPSDRSRLVRALVIVEPSTTMASDKLGGVLDVGGLLLLGGLGLVLRRRERA